MAAQHKDDQGREPLSRERVLRAAIALADEGGIAALSMRKLAQALRVEAMTLYYYVANKDALLAAIVDMVVGEVELPTDTSDWQAAIRRCGLSAHAAFLRHPWACSLVITTRGAESRTRYTEWLLRTLRQAGFSPELTYHAYHTIEGHITGFTLWQVSHSFDASSLRDLVEEVLRELPADRYPYLNEHVRQHLDGVAGDMSEFELGLDLILDGLERLRG